MVAHHAEQRQGQEEIEGGGHQRRHQHSARGGEADKQAVVYEGRHTRHGDEPRPEQVTVGSGHHPGVVGDEGEQTRAPHEIHEREGRH